MLRKQIWHWYAAGAFVFALLPGFLLGGLIFLTNASDLSDGYWRFGAASAHAHAQLFGWIALLILGVALHFLPRLRGVSLQSPTSAGWALALIAAGLAVRVITQPLFADGVEETWRQIVLIGSALLELIGLLLALFTLARTLRQPAPEGKGKPFSEIRGYVIVGGLGLAIAAILNLLRFVDSGALAMTLFSAQSEAATNLAGFYGFALPIALGMSVRLFPLYIQALPVHRRLLTLALETLVLGVVLAIAGMLLRQHEVFSVGQILIALAIVLGALAVRVFDRRRELPRRSSSPWHDPLQLLILSAYGWLIIAAIVLAVDGFDQGQLLFEIEYHLIGAGFLTLLIYGVGSQLLPGFAQEKLRSQSTSWLILAFGNLAVLTRLAPTLDQFGGNAGEWSGSIAGLSGALATLLFIWNIRFSLRQQLGGQRSRQQDDGDVQQQVHGG